MSTPSDCCNPCNVTPPVQVPGPEGVTGFGPQGPQGPAGTIPTPIAAYGSGTAYTMTASQALLNLGTVQPSIVLTLAGTYLLYGRARFDGVGATMTTQTLTTKLRCINNTVADVSNTTRVFDFIPSTTTSGTFAEITVPVVAYVASAGDNIQMFGALSGATGAGTITCVEADLVAVKIA